MENIAEKLLFDGYSEHVEEQIVRYYFCSEDLESAEELFFALYEEDIFEYTQNNYFDEEEYEVVGCTICLEMDVFTKAVEMITIAPTIEYSGQLEDIWSAEIELEDDLVMELLKKVETEGE